MNNTLQITSLPDLLQELTTLLPSPDDITIVLHQMYNICPVRYNLFRNILIEHNIIQPDSCTNIKALHPIQIALSQALSTYFSTYSENSDIYTKHNLPILHATIQGIFQQYYDNILIINQILAISLNQAYLDHFERILPTHPLNVIQNYAMNDPIRLNSNIHKHLLVDFPTHNLDGSPCSSQCRDRISKRLTTELVYGEFTLNTIINSIYNIIVDTQYFVSIYLPHTTHQQNITTTECNSLQQYMDLHNSMEIISSKDVDFDPTFSSLPTPFRFTNQNIIKYIAPDTHIDYHTKPYLGVTTPNSGQRMRVFCDYGSGASKPSIFLPFLTQSFTDFMGVEVLPNLHNIAVQYAKGTLMMPQPYNSLNTSKIVHENGDLCTSTTLPMNNINNNNIHLFNSSFFDIPCFSTELDVIIITSTCFSDEMFAQLAVRCSGLKKGTVIISLSEPLLHHELIVINTIHLPLTWGVAEAFFHVKV